jgi:hypothetical protein
MQTLIQDLRYALRQLRGAPGFTFTAVLTLALGVGATTAIFTLVYDVLLRPLPYAHPEQLVVMEEQVAEFRDINPKLPMNASHFVTWQQSSHSMQAMAVMEENSMPLGMGGHPLQVEVLSATSGIFSVVRSASQLGRAFTEQEAQTGHEHVAILMNDLWRSQFQGDPAILGRSKREIGLRLALGAQRATIYRLVIRDGLLPVLAGTAIGISIAFASARLAASLLFQVSPYNPALITAAFCLLLAVGVIACLLPARRAALLDPMQALRNDS